MSLNTTTQCQCAYCADYRAARAIALSLYCMSLLDGADIDIALVDATMARISAECQCHCANPNGEHRHAN